MTISTGLVFNPRKGKGFERNDVKCSNCDKVTQVCIDLNRNFLLCKNCLTEFISRIDEGILNN